MTEPRKGTVSQTLPQLDSLLRGEIAAAETYEQALEQLDESEADPLRPIQQSHGDAIRFFHSIRWPASTIR